MEAGQPRLIKGLQADYVPATYPGRNTSALKVYGKNLLVRVDQASTATMGGVLITDDMQEKMTEGSTSGCLFAIGPEAFRLFDDGTRWSGDHPEVGDRICFEKYAGLQQRGHDGFIYRIMDYRAVGAAVDEEYLASIGVEHAPSSAALRKK